jgi:hypothetical protein
MNLYIVENILMWLKKNALFIQLYLYSITVVTYKLFILWIAKCITLYCECSMYNFGKCIPQFYKLSLTCIYFFFLTLQRKEVYLARVVKTERPKTITHALARAPQWVVKVLVG